MKAVVGSRVTRAIVAGVAAIAVSLLVGCATPNSGSSNFVIPAGPEPTEQQAVDAAMSYLQRALKDPDSLKQFRITRGPVQMRWYQGLLAGNGNEEAWLICFEYNAKNSYGAYAGLKTDGLALRVSGDKAYYVDRVNWTMANTNCQGW